MKAKLLLLSVLVCLSSCASYSIGYKEADWAIPHSQALSECGYNSHHDDDHQEKDHWGCMASKGWQVTLIKK